MSISYTQPPQGLTVEENLHHNLKELDKLEEELEVMRRSGQYPEIAINALQKKIDKVRVDLNMKIVMSHLVDNIADALKTHNLQ